MFDAEVTLIPAYDRKNHLVSIIEIIAPVCAPRSLTQQPQHQNASSDAVRLARGAAHDLKNLLAIIKGNVELSQSAVRPNDARVFLREAEDACDMAARLADCMIGFARNRAGTPVAIDVAAAIHHQRAFLQHAAGPAIKITTDATPEAGFILADRTAFENAILNIALNARDAMPDGGNLAISVRTSEIAPAGIACPPAAHGYVEIAIADTGTGMTERVRQRAFDPFFSTKDASGGTGLGLATVLGFARQTGGTATIESRRGAGTTVKIILPKAP
jgi:signal transduction histidine kinase